MALSLIVFDCDGVLLESMDIKSMAFRRIGEEFGPEMADRLVMYHRMHGGVSRFKKFEWLFEELGRAATNEEMEALNAKFVEAAFEEMQRCPLVEGAREVLDHWKDRVPMFVASGAPEEELRTILEKRGLSRYFAGMFGSPTVKSQILRAIVQHAGAYPSDVVMVGDSRTDQYAAEAMRTRFYGRGEEFRLSGHPWHEDLTQLNDYLEQCFSEPSAWAAR